GAAAHYVKAGDPRVIAASKVIGGGESTTVAIPVGKLKAGESYTFVCTFPGHSSIMRGTLTLK
ncbi:plastocyanin/azurin family copper-binding protein, partial [Cutibacterium acnes]